MATLEKPGASSGDVLGGSKIGESGADYYVKVLGGDLDFFSPDGETTGGSDTAPAHENNGFLYGTHTLQGMMIQSQAVGLASIIDTSKNPAAITFDFGGTRRLTTTVLVRRIRIRHRYTSYFVGVLLFVKSTGSHPTEATI